MTNYLLNLRSFVIGSFCILGLSLVVVQTSLAQEVKKTVPDSLKKNEIRGVEKKSEDVKILLDKIEILGRIEKPQTVFIIPGKDPIADDIYIDRSFFKQIFRTIEKDQLKRRIKISKQ